MDVQLAWTTLAPEFAARAAPLAGAGARFSLDLAAMADLVSGADCAGYVDVTAEIVV